MSPTPHGTLTRLLDLMDEAATAPSVSVRDLLERIGEQSILPLVLAVSIIIVSPISGIPGVPTISALILLTLMMQVVLQRRHIWLPGFILRREINGPRLQKAITWLRKPGAWFDRHSKPRFLLLTAGPLRWLTLTICMAVPLAWPFLELLPMVTSFGAGAISLMAFGLLTRDGLYVLAGYIVVATMVLLATTVVAAV
ncbi:MAG: exopolysaccharide biosynthesis protein [Pseudomonadota bacterium]